MKKNTFRIFGFAGITALCMSGMLFLSCSSANNDGRTSDAVKEEAIAVHDEIMPQIGSFDRQGIRIDSILLSLDSLKQLQPELDTAQVRIDLTALKSRLESATDAMMVWMSEFESKPNQETEEGKKSYFESELQKVNDMKKTFDEVSKESTEKLARF